MSRTPVRQALPLLAQEGLLAVHESRGYVVRAFTAGDVLDAIDIRGVLEGLAARRVAEHGATKPFLRKLHACLHDGDTLLAKRRMEESDEATYSEMNGRFHSLILEEAGSQILSEALRELPRPVRRPAGDCLRPDQRRTQLRRSAVRASAASRDRRRDRAWRAAGWKP